MCSGARNPAIPCSRRVSARADCTHGRARSGGGRSLRESSRAPHPGAGDRRPARAAPDVTQRPACPPLSGHSRPGAARRSPLGPPPRPACDPAASFDPAIPNGFATWKDEKRSKSRRWSVMRGRLTGRAGGSPPAPSAGQSLAASAAASPCRPHRSRSRARRIVVPPACRRPRPTTPRPRQDFSLPASKPCVSISFAERHTGVWLRGRAHPSHGWGHKFKSCNAHHLRERDSATGPFFMFTGNAKRVRS